MARKIPQHPISKCDPKTKKRLSEHGTHSSMRSPTWCFKVCFKDTSKASRRWPKAASQGPSEEDSRASERLGKAQLGRIVADALKPRSCPKP